MAKDVPGVLLHSTLQESALFYFARAWPQHNPPMLDHFMGNPGKSTKHVQPWGKGMLTGAKAFSGCTEGRSRLGDDALQGSTLDQAVLPVRRQVPQLGPDKVVAG